MGHAMTVTTADCKTHKTARRARFQALARWRVPGPPSHPPLISAVASPTAAPLINTAASARWGLGGRVIETVLNSFMLSTTATHRAKAAVLMGGLADAKLTNGDWAISRGFYASTGEQSS